MENNFSSRKIETASTGLLDVVFSWSFRDVLNKDLYKDTVKRIPEEFSSTSQYTSTFKFPLVEETRASLCSGLESIGHAPACEVTKVEWSNDYNPPKELYYNFFTKKISDFKVNGGHYEPEAGDLIVFSNFKPRKMDDLHKPGELFVVALVTTMDEGSDMTRVLLSKEIDDTSLFPRPHKRVRVFATYLINLITNTRIWKALNCDPQVLNMSLALKVLRLDSNGGEDCSTCLPEGEDRNADFRVQNAIEYCKLDEAQKKAVLSSVSMRECRHQKDSVKLIWGPPGTGKTKTVACLLFSLFELKCRTLACAPTNIAVMQLAKRLMSLVLERLKYDTYGLGDVVLFGNGERMKVDEHDELLNVFLDYRAEVLSKCLSPSNGWKGTLDSMISLLEQPEEQYQLYLRNGRVHNEVRVEEEDSSHDSIEESDDDDDEYYDASKDINEESDDDVDDDAKGKGLIKKGDRTKHWKGVIDQALKVNKKYNNNVRNNEESDDDTKGKGLIKKVDRREHWKGVIDQALKVKEKYNNKGGKVECDHNNLLSFEEFVRNRFYSLAERLAFLMKSLYTHQHPSLQLLLSKV